MPAPIPAACPVCGNHLFREAIGIETIKHEIQLRREFVCSRLRRRADRSELKDLLDFMHGRPAPVLECLNCGLLLRAEDGSGARGYETDPNDPDLMAEVYTRYLQAFRQKEVAYRDRLKPHAEVLEIGPHIGAFLQTAEEWNWHPIGIDIGKDTTEFIRKLGLTVRRSTLDDANLPGRTFEAVFIWNCFEQLPDPVSALLEIRRILKPHGVVVIRVPNTIPYRVLRRDARMLAYNNLLGFPYLYGYTIENLNWLLAGAGFRPESGYNSELVTLPFPDQVRRVRQEQLAVSRRTAKWSTRTTRELKILTAPWIEVVYRRVKEREPLTPFKPGSIFLPRAA